MRLYPTSLLLVSAYGLLDNLTRLMLGVFVGQYIDRSALQGQGKHLALMLGDSGLPGPWNVGGMGVISSLACWHHAAAQ